MKNENTTEQILIALVAAVLILFLNGFIVQWLWNELVPQIFGITTITYWQGVGLVILTHSLFSKGGKVKTNN